MQEALRLAITSFVLPPGGALLLLAMGLACWRSRPRLARGLCRLGTAYLWLAATPIVASALVTALGGGQPLDPQQARSDEAIVILGGGVRPQAPEYGGDTLGRLTLERVRYGAHLARQTGLPVLVTGGAPEPGVRAEADLMREALEHEYGVPVRWIDAEARNTRENAANAARLLAADGRRRVVLVMHGFDVRRATREFERAGLTVLAAPTSVPRWDQVELGDLLPSVAALQTSGYALYEALALVRNALLGRS